MLFAKLFVTEIESATAMLAKSEASSWNDENGIKCCCGIKVAKNPSQRHYFEQQPYSFNKSGVNNSVCVVSIGVRDNWPMSTLLEEIVTPVLVSSMAVVFVHRWQMSAPLISFLIQNQNFCNIKSAIDFNDESQTNVATRNSAIKKRRPTTKHSAFEYVYGDGDICNDVFYPTIR